MFRASHASLVEGEQPEWLQVIWECNRMKPDMFGKPEIKPWWAGGMVEEYPTARVIIVGDDTVRVVGKTEEAEGLIQIAARKLGFITW